MDSRFSVREQPSRSRGIPEMEEVTDRESEDEEVQAEEIGREPEMAGEGGWIYALNKCE